MVNMPKYLFLIFIACLVFLLGLFVIKQRRTLPHITGFFLCVLSALSLIFLLGREWSLDRNRVPLPWNNLFDAAFVLHSFTAVCFALSFPAPSPHFKKIFSPLAAVSLAIAGFALAGANFSKHDVINHVHVIHRTPFYNIYLVFSLSTVTATIWILLQKYRRLRKGNADERAKKSLLIILVGFSLSILIGFFFIFVQPILLHEIRYFYLLSNAFLVGACSAFYAIVKYNAFDIETVIHKTMSWLFLSSVPLVGAALAGLWLGPLLEGASPSKWAFVIGGMSSLIGLYLYIAQPYIDQLFDRRKYDLRKTLDETIRDLAVLQDFQPMAQKILEQICKALPLQSASALILGPDRKQLLSVAGKDRTVNDSVPIPPVVLEKLQNGSTLELDQTLPPTDQAEKDDPITWWLKEQGFAFCLPLTQKAELIGVIALGRKRNLQPFTVREKTFLAQIGAAATIAFSNSLLLERVRELDRLKTEFLSEVAHELRVPLFGISSIAEGMLSDETGDLQEDRRRLIGNIRETAVEMKDLVDHLLDLSKIEMGIMAYDFREIEIGSIVRLAVDLAGGAASSKGLHLSVEVGESLPAIQGDKARVRQCLSNLLSNAIKYTDQGTIRVICQAMGQGVQITIEDSGRGMTEEEARLVFERYRRGREVGPIEGSGLGLALTKEIIEAHGGTIGVESRVGAGSRFSFYLPGNITGEAVRAGSHIHRMRPMVERRRMLQATEIDEKEDIPIGRGEMLVIVDDSDTEREALRTFLEGKGFLVLTARNGVEGLDLVRSKRPSLVITDMIMPLLSGPELCALLKEDPVTSAIPIIMVTARNHLGDMVFGIRMGADDYIAKPYDVRELCVRISALLRMQRIRDDLESARKQTVDLEEKHDRLNSILQNKNDLILQLSHEVKTPLMALSSLVSNLNDGVVGPVTDRQRAYFIHLKTLSRRIRQLLTTLLHFALAESGAIRLQKRQIQIMDVACQVLFDLQPFREERGVECMIAESVRGKSAFADQDRIEQILLNLIHNAIKASPSGSRVIIDAEEKGPELIVSVTDSGPGIPPTEQMKLLQEPLYSGKSQGGGLGLYISRYLVELHGGHIWFDTWEGKGTTFFFSVPNAAADITSERKQHVSANPYRG
jgi:signal transduction histidine kinase